MKSKKQYFSIILFICISVSLFAQLAETPEYEFESNLEQSLKKPDGSDRSSLLLAGELLLAKRRDHHNSTEWYENDSTEYHYNNEDQLIREIYFLKIDSVWTPITRYLYEYDTNGAETLERIQSWDGNDWVNNAQFILEYHWSGEYSLYQVQGWDGSEWISTYEYAREFDINGNIVYGLAREIDDLELVNVSQVFIEYDSLQNMSASLIQEWDGMDWVNDQRFTFASDQLGRRILSVTEQWFDMEFYLFRKNVYEYNDNDDMTLRFIQRYDHDSLDWINYIQYIYEFDSDYNNIHFFGQSWISADTAWSDFVVRHYEYDENDNLTWRININWDQTEWDTLDQYFYEYDEDNNLVFEFYQRHFGSWLDFDRIYYFYGIPTATPELITEISAFSVYPNPGNGWITLDLHEFEEESLHIQIFTNTGKRVYFNTFEYVSENIELDLSRLAEGSYFVQLTSGSYIKTTQLMILH